MRPPTPNRIERFGNKASRIALVATLGALLPLAWPNGLTLVGLLFSMACFAIEVSLVLLGYVHHGAFAAVAFAVAVNAASYVAWMVLVLFVTAGLGGRRPAA